MVVAGDVNDPHVMDVPGRLSCRAIWRGEETDGEDRSERSAYDDHRASAPGDAGDLSRLRAHPSRASRARADTVKTITGGPSSRSP